MGGRYEDCLCCCQCNCGIKILAFANGSCGGNQSYKLYLKVGDSAVETDGPSNNPTIEKTYTENPGDICCWWHETDTSSGQSLFDSLIWFGFEGPQSVFEVKGKPQVTDDSNNLSFTAPDQILDSSDQFIDKCFETGLTITVAGSSSNDGTYEIESISAGAITTVETTISTEGATGSVSVTADDPDSVEADICLSTCEIDSGATITSATLQLHLHQNVLGTEEGLIEVTSIKVYSDADSWTSAELLGSPEVVPDYTDHPGSSDYISATATGVNADRLNDLCCLIKFSAGSGQLCPGEVEFDDIILAFDYESAGGASPGAFGGVVVSVDPAVDAPRCQLESCGNPVSPFGRLCPGEHVSDDSGDQSEHTPTQCFQVDCVCVNEVSLLAADQSKETQPTTKTKRIKYPAGWTKDIAQQKLKTALQKKPCGCGKKIRKI